MICFISQLLLQPFPYKSFFDLLKHRLFNLWLNFISKNRIKNYKISSFCKEFIKFQKFVISLTKWRWYWQIIPFDFPDSLHWIIIHFPFSRCLTEVLVVDEVQQLFAFSSLIAKIKISVEWILFMIEDEVLLEIVGWVLVTKHAEFKVNDLLYVLLPQSVGVYLFRSAKSQFHLFDKYFKRPNIRMDTDLLGIREDIFLKIGHCNHIFCNFYICYMREHMPVIKSSDEWVFHSYPVVPWIALAQRMVLVFLKSLIFRLQHPLGFTMLGFIYHVSKLVKDWISHPACVRIVIVAMLISLIWILWNTPSRHWPLRSFTRQDPRQILLITVACNPRWLDHSVELIGSLQDVLAFVNMQLTVDQLAQRKLPWLHVKWRHVDRYWFVLVDVMIQWFLLDWSEWVLCFILLDILILHFLGFVTLCWSLLLQLGFEFLIFTFHSSSIFRKLNLWARHIHTFSHLRWSTRLLWPLLSFGFDMLFFLHINIDQSLACSCLFILKCHSAVLIVSITLYLW